MSSKQKTTLKYCISQDKKSYCVTGVKNLINGEIVIPSTYRGLPVTTIKKYAFNNCNSLKSLVIPETVNYFEDEVFDSYEGFENVYYLGTIESWLDISFETTSSSPMHSALYFYIKDNNNNWYTPKEIVIADTVKNIKDFSFYGFEDLETVVIGNSVETIGVGAFCVCSSLQKVIIPNSVKRIEFIAFSSCVNLKEVKLPESLEVIGMDAFSRCESISEVYIPSSVTSIGSNAFSEDYGIKSIVVDKNNKVYDSRDNCNAIIETKTNTLLLNCDNSFIPETVTIISDEAFNNCGPIEKLYIPKNVVSISKDAFSNLYGVKEIIVDKDNKVYDSRDNCNAIIETNTNTLLFACDNTIIPSSVTSIGDLAFSNCSDIKHIIIPNSIKKMGQFPFHGCYSLEKVTILSNSIKTDIGSFDFPSYGESLKIYFVGSKEEFEQISKHSIINENAKIIFNYKEN